MDVVTETAELSLVGVKISVLVGLFEESFELCGWQFEQRDALGHKGSLWNSVVGAWLE